MFPSIILMLKYILFAINTLIYQVHHLKSEIPHILTSASLTFIICLSPVASLSGYHLSKAKS